jgi:hypothetical protein
VWGEWLVVFGGWDGDRHLHDTHLLHLETMHWLQPPTPSGEARTNPLIFRTGLKNRIGF